LFECDLANAPLPMGGGLSLSDEPGIGVAPLRDDLARCAVGIAEEIGA
jgi:hypothetical protein